MSSRRHLNPDQFSMVTDTDRDQGIHSVDAFHPGYLQGQHPVGSMLWEIGSGRITNISVDDQHRRQGIATRMYNHVNEKGYGSEPRHDVESMRTKLGSKWVSSVGGPSLSPSAYDE
jgi:ribosomal protein S18 acetylase RimI-like enzyme